MSSPSQTSAASANGLPHGFIDHLKAEESALKELLAAVRDIHKALRKNDLDSFTSALQREARATRSAEEVAQRRPEVFQSVAAVVVGPAQQSITLGGLVEQLSGHAKTVVAGYRGRLHEMGSEVERLNRQNAAMVQQSVEVTRLVMSALTQEEPGGVSYDSRGARQEAVGGSIFELGG